MGASSFSPSPMTMTPSIWMSFSTCGVHHRLAVRSNLRPGHRMDGASIRASHPSVGPLQSSCGQGSRTLRIMSTAAWSAAFLSPLPSLFVLLERWAQGRGSAAAAAATAAAAAQARPRAGDGPPTAAVAPPRRGECRGLGHADQLQCQVARGSRVVWPSVLGTLGSLRPIRLRLESARPGWGGSSSACERAATAAKQRYIYKDIQGLLMRIQGSFEEAAARELCAGNRPVRVWRLRGLVCSGAPRNVTYRRMHQYKATLLCSPAAATRRRALRRGGVVGKDGTKQACRGEISSERACGTIERTALPSLLLLRPTTRVGKGAILHLRSCCCSSGISRREKRDGPP